MPAGDVGQRLCLLLTQLCPGLRRLGLKHIHTMPYTPRTNGKAEHFIQTLCREWAYSMPFHNSEERNRWLPRYLSIYNRSGVTQPSAADPLSSGSTSCSADQRGETQHLARAVKNLIGIRLIAGNSSIAQRTLKVARTQHIWADINLIRIWMLAGWHYQIANLVGN